MSTSSSPPRNALVTASYARDFERCRLLCETVDRHVTGVTRHLLLVAHEDVELFRQLESARRMVVDERDILPSWLRSFPDPTSLFRRRIWLGWGTAPLRGWHVQQLRRIAIAAQVEEDGLVYCDSDVVFLKAFDCASLWRGTNLRLFRRDDALADPASAEHRLWSRNAGNALGLGGAESLHDYIANLVAWRRDSVLAMCARLEAVQGRHWIAAVASTRRFSECMIYGRHADEVLGRTGHVLDPTELCRVYWDGAALSAEAVRDFAAAMTPEQVAIGMQSFIGTDLGHIRRIASAA